MKTANYYTVYENIIINNINLDAYDMSNNQELFDKIKSVHNIFKSEYGHEIKRRGEKKAFKEWLQGLPSVLTVPFYNNEILNIGYVHGLVKADATEEEEDNFLNEYFFNLARAFFVLKENL